MRDILKTLQTATWKELWQEIFMPFLSVCLIGYVMFWLAFEIARWIG